MRPKGGWPDENIWKGTLLVFCPCNSLKYHKTAKAFFGNPWTKTAHFWKSLTKALEAAFIPPLRPPRAAPRRRFRTGAWRGGNRGRRRRADGRGFPPRRSGRRR